VGESLKHLTLEGLTHLVKGWGEPSYTAHQLWRWLYEKGETDPHRMTNLSAKTRYKLAEMGEIPTLRVIQRQVSRDGTVKYVLQGYDGQGFEAVWLPSPSHHTVCISTQIGCPVQCPFCATGQMGWTRNLSVGEIVDQIHVIEKDQQAAVRNIVLMGMGEPLLNYGAVKEAVSIWREVKGLSWKHMTLSTSGYLPGLERLVADRWLVRLALSLHSPINELRDRLVPLNKTYPLESLWPLCRAYTEYAREPVTLEYVLLGGVNDSPALARALVRVASQFASKVNVIPWNPIGRTDFHPPLERDQKRFVDILRQKGIRVTLRKARGVDIDAACGQLLVKREGHDDFGGL